MSSEDAVAVAGISADGALAFMEQADKAEAPPPETSAAPAAEAPPPAPPAAEQPAPAPAAPASVKLDDSTRVIDPADGAEKTWGEIKAERLRQADYTKKTMSLADERRQIMAERQKIAAEQQRLAAEIEAMKAQAQTAGLPKLPEDDPYAQHLIAQQKQFAAMQAAMREMAQRTEQAEAERNLVASRAALAAKEKQMTEQFKFDEREVSFVEAEYWRRRGEPGVTLDSVAAEYRGYLDGVAERAVREWKEKNRVAAPAAAATTQSAGAAPPEIDIKSDSFIEMIKQRLSGA